jgi:hypothetical protein
MGLAANFEEETAVELRTSEGDEVQVLAPGDPYDALFQEHAAGPVQLFEVDDIHSARTELAELAIGNGSISERRTGTCTSSPAASTKKSRSEAAQPATLAEERRVGRGQRCTPTSS